MANNAVDNEFTFGTFHIHDKGVILLFNNTVNLNQWHHIAIVRDLGALRLSVYVDGVFINNTAIAN